MYPNTRILRGNISPVKDSDIILKKNENLHKYRLWRFHTAKLSNALIQISIYIRVIKILLPFALMKFHAWSGQCVRWSSFLCPFFVHIFLSLLLSATTRTCILVQLYVIQSLSSEYNTKWTHNTGPVGSTGSAFRLSSEDVKFECRSEHQIFVHKVHHGCPQYLQTNSEIVPHLDHDLFLPCPLQIHTIIIPPLDTRQLVHT
jgi:hypothetical protein